MSVHSAVLANKEPPKAGAMDHLFDLLGKSTALRFGRECASATIWMLCILLIRSALSTVGCLSLVPNAFVFALPFLIQLLVSFFPFMSKCFPLLPVRIAETVLGRMEIAHLVMVVLPSHLIGCIMGVVLFKALLPFCPVEVR